MEKRVAIFCSSNENIDPAYNEAARALTRALCAAGYTILSGGSWRGTMGVVSDEVVRCGGRHIGVLPRFMERFAYDNLTDMQWTETMARRKELMREGTVAVIALPGGIGTLDELIETHVLSKLGRYDGKLLALNVGGFYEPVKALFQHYVDTGMTHPDDAARVVFADSVEALMEALQV